MTLCGVRQRGNAAIFFVSVSTDEGLISTLQSQVGNKANTADVQSWLNGKANSSHSHEIGNVDGLQSALNGKQAAGSYVSFNSDSTNGAQIFQRSGKDGYSIQMNGKDINTIGLLVYLDGYLGIYDYTSGSNVASINNGSPRTVTFRATVASIAANVSDSVALSTSDSIPSGYVYAGIKTFKTSWNLAVSKIDKTTSGFSFNYKNITSSVVKDVEFLVEALYLPSKL